MFEPYESRLPRMSPVTESVLFVPGVPTWASVVLFTTEMPTEGLIDTDPPDEPATAFVLTTSVDPAANVRLSAPVNCAVFWRSASVLLVAMVNATAAPTPAAPPPLPPANPTGGCAIVVSVALSCALNATLPSMEAVEPDGTHASLVLDTMFKASAPASPTFLPDAPAVADAVVLSTFGVGEGVPGVAVCTLIVGAESWVLAVVLSIVAVLLASVSLIATPTPTLEFALLVVESPSAVVEALLFDDASMLMALPAVTVDESTYAWVVGVNLVTATEPATPSGSPAEKAVSAGSSCPRGWGWTALPMRDSRGRPYPRECFESHYSVRRPSPSKWRWYLPCSLSWPRRRPCPPWRWNHRPPRPRLCYCRASRPPLLHPRRPNPQHPLSPSVYWWS